MSQHQNTIRVGLVEPSLLLREALTALLERRAGLTVVAATATLAGMSPIVTQSSPDVLLLGLPGFGEDEEAALDGWVNESTFPCRLIVVTDHADPGLQLRLTALGVSGVVRTDQTGDILVKAIAKVHAGELWFDRLGLTAVVNTLVRRGPERGDEDTAKVASLTAREREIVALVAEGMTNAGIGERLFISAITVRNHLTSILAKLDLPDRFQLAVYAYRRGVVLCAPTADMRQMSATIKAVPLRASRPRRTAGIRGG